MLALKRTENVPKLMNRKILIVLLVGSILFFSNQGITSKFILPDSVQGNSSIPKLVLLGDSITKSSLGSLYINNLTTMPYWNALSVVNSGLAATSVNSFYNNEALVNQRVSQYNPDYILVFLGLADAAWYGNEYTFEREYKWLIRTIIQQNNESQLLLTKFSWASTASLTDQESHVAIIENISLEFQLPFSDVFHHTKGHLDWFIDGVHPNARGAYEIAKCLNNSFSDYLNGSEYIPITQVTSSNNSSSVTKPQSIPGILLITVVIVLNLFSIKRKFLK